jgi:peptide deformylase
MHLHLITAPNPIFKQIAEPVAFVDDDIRAIVDAMFEVLYHERGLGLGANMVGVLQRICVVDCGKEGKPEPITLINPEILEASDEVAEYEEASLSYPGISAKIMRPKNIKVKFLDREGKSQTLDADVPLSTVIQHEMDYLDGRTYLDTLSKMKRDRLLKKMQKYIKFSQPSDCGDPSCGHEH